MFAKALKPNFIPPISYYLHHKNLQMNAKVLRDNAKIFFPPILSFFPPSPCLILSHVSAYFYRFVIIIII